MLRTSLCFSHLLVLTGAVFKRERFTKSCLIAFGEIVNKIPTASNSECIQSFRIVTMVACISLKVFVQR